MKMEVRMRRWKWVSAVSLLALAGCRPGRPLVDFAAKDNTARGTIGGILQGPGGGEPIPGRHVYAIEIRTGARFSAVTNVTGGFSIEVPPGKYRLEVELREGEAVVRNPGTIDINRSDLDSNIKVEVGASP